MIAIAITVVDRATPALARVQLDMLVWANVDCRCWKPTRQGHDTDCPAGRSPRRAGHV